MADPPPLPPAEDLQHMLFEAARRGDDAVLAALIRAGVDLEAVNDRGHSPLLLATYHDRRQATALLLDAGAQADGVGEGNTPLMGAVFKGHAAIVELLLARGADPNKRGAAGQTALMTAARHDQPAMADLLLAHGADPTLTDDEGATAANLAQAQGCSALAVRLAEVGGLPTGGV